MDSFAIQKRSSPTTAEQGLTKARLRWCYCAGAPPGTNYIPGITSLRTSAKSSTAWEHQETLFRSEIDSSVSNLAAARAAAEAATPITDKIPPAEQPCLAFGRRFVFRSDRGDFLLPLGLFSANLWEDFASPRAIDAHETAAKHSRLFLSGSTDFTEDSVYRRSQTSR